MSDNFIGRCTNCHLPIYIDEGYKVVENKFDGLFMKFICEECDESVPQYEIDHMDNNR